MELVPIGQYQVGPTRGISGGGGFTLALAILMSMILFYMISATISSIQKENRVIAIFNLFILIAFIPLNAVAYSWAFHSKPVYTQQYSVQITEDTDIYRLSQEYEITGISDGAIMVIAKENNNETVP